MRGVLYESESIFVFLLVTVAMGGWAAWMTGRALALTWRPDWMVVIAIAGLAVAVRFIHFALFGGTFLSIHYFAIDLVLSLAFGLLGYRYSRARQMTTQYRWLYERSGPLSWRERPPAP